ncbi:elongation factor 1-beta [Candidatus Woesearchaeota archaeon]|nr:elongation factor 1-beta [Candidatus Woesearchaeota archaeon]
MAQVIVTMKIMPESPDTDLSALEKKATHSIHEFGGQVGKVDIEPIAFGLKALKILFLMSEEKGSTDSLEQEISGHPGVNSVDVIDVRRAIG